MKPEKVLVVLSAVSNYLSNRKYFINLISYFIKEKDTKTNIFVQDTLKLENKSSVH